MSTKHPELSCNYCELLYKSVYSCDSGDTVTLKHDKY